MQESDKIIDQRYIGIDVGRADVKVALFNQDGTIGLSKYSSIAAVAPIEAEDMPMMDGKRYYVGDVALNVEPDRIIDTSDSSKIKLLSPLFLAKTIKEKKIDKENIEAIGSGLSVAEIDEVSNFRKRLMRFKINKETFDFKDKVHVLPQSIGAKYAIEHFYKDLPDTYLIVDIGFNTIDTATIILGQARMEGIKGFKDEGAIKVARPIQAEIYEKFKDLISIKEVQEVLRTKQYYIDGEYHDLSEEIKKHSEEYSAHLLNFLKSRFPNEFKKYKKIFLVGGGAKFLSSIASDSLEVVPDSEYYNAIGNLIKAKEVSLKT